MFHQLGGSSTNGSCHTQLT